MKNNSTRMLLILIALVVPGIAAAAPGKDNPGIPGQVLRNSDDIADNFSQIQSNRADIMDLDNRVSDLESNGGGATGGERSYVDVDCTINGDANALLTDEGASIYFPPDTTYNISGACNGPLFVVEDGVRFVGVAGSNPEIVLPGDTPNPGDGAIFVDGANDVRVQNLVVNASAWGSGAIAEGTDAAGIYVRNSFVRVIDTRIVGGLWSINPFRKALVRTGGLVQLEGFVNAGLSVGDQSLVSARGPVLISSGVTDGSYLTAIEAYRSGAIDLRSGVVVNLPPPNPDINFYPGSIYASELSQLRVRNSGDIDIHGDVFVGRSSILRLDGGTLAGSIIAEENSSLGLRNLTQTTGGISLQMNSTANLNNVQAGALFAYTNSSAQVFNGSLNGANLDQGATASFYGTSVSADVTLASATYLNFFGNGSGSMNGYTVYKCGEFVVANIAPDVAMVGGVVDCIFGS